MNRKAFFDSVRESLFNHTLRQEQVQGLDTILDEWERRKLGDRRWLAYICGTGYHETGMTMQPIDEYGGRGYWMRMYDVTGDYPDRARANGNTAPGDGATYHGRGYPQLTWKNNYLKMGRILGIDLVNNPDMAKQNPHAVRIMFEGMLRADSHFGDFTGVALEDYFNDHMDDPINARRVVNGLDKAQQIAGYYHHFLDAVRLL